MYQYQYKYASINKNMSSVYSDLLIIKSLIINC